MGGNIYSPTDLQVENSRYINKVKDIVKEINKIPNITMSSEQVNLSGMHLNNKEMILKPIYTENSKWKKSEKRYRRCLAIEAVLRTAAKFDLRLSPHPIKGNRVMIFTMNYGSTWR